MVHLMWNADMRFSAITKTLHLRFLSRLLFIFALAMPQALSAQDQPLRIALWALPQEGAHPLSNSTYPAIMILPAIFDGLTSVDAKGDVQPALAVSWRQVDTLTWDFELRPGVTFSNGELFTADAVVNAFDFLADDPGAATPVARTVDFVDRVVANNSLSIRIHTNRPVPRLPYEITAVRIPAPEHWASMEAAAFSRNPVGTGPYVVERWSSAEVTLKAFESSWRAPKIANVKIAIVSEETARLQALQSGTVDIAVGLGPDARPVLQSIGGRLIDETSTSMLGLAFVTTQKDSPIRDRRVRQALNFAVNRDAIIESLYGGATEPGGQVVIPQAFGYNASLPPYEFDPARAISLLSEAGYADGFDFPVEVNAAMGGSASAVYQQVSIDLARIGVRAELIPISTVTLVQRIVAGGWDGLAFSMDFDSTKALDGLRPFKLHSCLRAIAWFCEPKYTGLIRAAELESDLNLREDMIRNLARAYYEDPPGIILFQATGSVGLGPKVGTYGADFGAIRYDEITFSK